ncbi:hypoxia induced protein [Bosea sp. BK604]|nr:hypoxia induced protein [Bosea sp. BK604]
MGLLAKPSSPQYISAMSFTGSLVPIAVGAVAVVLVLGLVNMLRGGSANTSQKLMRLRVVLQFIAILVIVGVLWWRGG